MKKTHDESTAQEIIDADPGYEVAASAYRTWRDGVKDVVVEVSVQSMDGADITDTLRIPLSFFIKKRNDSPKGKRPHTKRSDFWKKKS